MTDVDNSFVYDPDGAPHDLPTAGQLLDAVRVWLDDEVVPALEGRMKLHARVAANMLGIVERELEFGPDQRARHAERMADFGVVDEQELAARVAGGDFDDQADELTAVLRETVRDKLRVANPGYLGA